VEGVSVRLGADKSRWMSNETPTFKVDVRNQGKREFSTFQSQKMGRLEVDGVWYDWTGEIDLKSSWLPPGREYHDIRVSLGSDWKATQEWRDKELDDMLLPHLTGNADTWKIALIIASYASARILPQVIASTVPENAAWPP